MSNLDFVEKVKLFNEIAGKKEEFNVKNVSLYMGLVLEEVSEMLESLNLNDDAINDLLIRLDDTSFAFKRNEYEESIGSFIDRKEFLDGAIDTAVVGLGAAIAVGADVIGACNEVAESNLSKYDFVDDKYVVLFDENGKIKKGPNYWKPQLNQYIK